jgi:hypothetical protein
VCVHRYTSQVMVTQHFYHLHFCLSGVTTSVGWNQVPMRPVRPGSCVGEQDRLSQMWASGVPSCGKILPTFLNPYLTKVQPLCTPNLVHVLLWWPSSHSVYNLSPCTPATSWRWGTLNKFPPEE